MVALFALLSLLVVLIVRPAWPDIGPFGPLADPPWWLTGVVLAGGALFVVALVRVSRAVAWWGTALLVLVAGAAGWSASLRDAAETADASALLAAALGALAAALLAVGLSAVPSGWRLARDAFTNPPTARRRGWRALVAMVLPGVLLGGSLGAMAGPSGEHLHETMREEPESLVDSLHATSEAVDDVFTRDAPASAGREQGEGWQGTDGIQASEVSWQENWDGPVELAECVAVPTSDKERAGTWGEDGEYVLVAEDDERSLTSHSTLVALDGFHGVADAEAARDGADQSVVGLDPASGEELWRYTVHGDQPRRIGQVAVGVDCEVLVLVDPGFLVALSPLTGEVRDTVLLPSPLHSDDEPAPSDDPFDVERQWWELETTVDQETFWRFPGAARQDEGAPGVVLLPPSEVAVLAVTNRLMTVRRENAEIVSYDEEHAEYCEYLVDYGLGPVVLRHGCGPPALHSLGGGLDRVGLYASDWEGTSDLDSALGAPAAEVPDLGCWEADGMPWSNWADFTWLERGVAGEVLLSGGCVWDNIEPTEKEADPFPPDDAGDRLVRMGGDFGPPDYSRTISRPDSLAGGPTPFWRAGGWNAEGVFHVHDGAVHQRRPGHPGVFSVFRDPEGVDIVAVSPPRGLAGATGYPVAAVTEDGSVVFHRYLSGDEVRDDEDSDGDAEDDAEDTDTDLGNSEHTGRTDAARASCDGTRDVRADARSETVLVLCVTDDPDHGQRTEITALAEPGAGR